MLRRRVVLEPTPRTSQLLLVGHCHEKLPRLSSISRCIASLSNFQLLVVSTAIILSISVMAVGRTSHAYKDLLVLHSLKDHVQEQNTTNPRGIALSIPRHRIAPLSAIYIERTYNIHHIFLSSSIQFQSGKYNNRHGTSCCQRHPDHRDPHYYHWIHPKQPARSTEQWEFHGPHCRR